MNVARLELSKELYEVSGWEADQTWAEDGGGEAFLCRSDFSDLGHESWRVAYAYDLGYLLRKLPKKLARGYWLALAPLDSEADEWEAGYFQDREHSPHQVYADTPEDAATKLALELFKQGVLTRGES
jgi:hypothetical protein